jgi:multicomponent K+:H+ antiporter subunit G
MSAETIALFAIAFCLVVGAIFTIVGSIGLLKFNDSMTRLHAPTKVGTMGVGALLLASMIHSYMFGDGSIHELLIMAFLFVTAPISANFMAKVNIHRRACDAPPPPERDETWSTLDAPEAGLSRTDKG